MEAKGVAVWQAGAVFALGRKPLCRGRVPQMHGVTYRNRVRLVWWDESATQDKVLYPL